MGDVVIIGAGPAGLTCAYELSKLGRRALLLEADPIVGGLSRTVVHDGYRFDIGGHRFFSKVPLVNEIWHELLGPDMLRRQRLSRIHYRNRFFDYPLKPMNALRGLGTSEAIRIVLSYAHSQVPPKREIVSFEDWVTSQFGYRLYEIFFKTYTEKVWGIPCSEISADWADQRIKNLSLVEALRHAVLRRKQASDGEVVTTLIEEFLYPRLGPGMMWERCAERLAAYGSPTIHDTRVERIRLEGGRVASVTARQSDGEVVEHGVEHLISTMPIRELIQALDPLPPADVQRAATALRYRDYLTVVLIVKREEVFPDNWVYVHSPEVRLGRIQNYKNWSPEMVPDPRRTSLGLEYFLWDRDEHWEWPADRLIEAGIEDCKRIGLLGQDEVEDGTVVRMRKAYPVYDHDYQKHLTTIRSYLATIPNLQLIGRNGQHRYNNQDHSMMTGVYAARNLMGADFDVWSVNTEKVYHEAGPSQRMVPMRHREHVATPVEPRVDIGLVRLDPSAFAVAVGVWASLSLLLITTVTRWQGEPQAVAFLELVGQYLPGFAIGWTGMWTGAAQALLAGAGGGYSMARLHNAVLGAYAGHLRRRAASDDLQGRL